MTKMKITRKDILELVEGIRDVEKGMGWRLWRAGAYTHGGKVSLFAAYHGQGLDSVVYNEAYDDICEFADVIEDEDYSNEDRVDLILDRIADLELPEVRKSIPVRLDEGLHKEFMKKLIDDGMSAQKFLEARIIEYVGDKLQMQFDDQALISGKHIADLADLGEFHAATVENDPADSPYTFHATGRLVRGELSLPAELQFVLDELPDKMTAASVFQSGWDDWQVETSPNWIHDDEDWYGAVTGYWNGEPVVVDMVTGSIAFVDEGEGLALDCAGGRYHAVVEAGKWAYHHDPNPPADTVEWDGDDEIARAAGWSDEDED